MIILITILIVWIWVAATAGFIFETIVEAICRIIKTLKEKD